MSAKTATSSPGTGDPGRPAPVAISPSPSSTWSTSPTTLSLATARLRAEQAPPARERREAVAVQASFGPMRPRRGQTADLGRLVRAFVDAPLPDDVRRGRRLRPCTGFGALAVWRSTDSASQPEGRRSSGPAPSTQIVPAGPATGPSATAVVPTDGPVVVAATVRGPIPAPATVPDRPAEKRKDIPLRRDTQQGGGAVAEIDENILAKSSQAPFQSRVRTWQEACETWAVAPWPISAEAVRKVAATFRRGGYRSVQNYFDAAVSYQEQFRGEAVDPLIRRAMRRYARAVVRGLPGSKLKAIFAVDRLVALVSRVDPPGSDARRVWVTAHAVDALILAVWFMLREIEFSAARTEDIDVADGTVTFRLPLHKTATGGEVELTQRQLRCACGATVAPLCPYHAALRHVSRLWRAGRWVRAGDTWEKSEAVLFFRRVLLAAGIQLTTTDHNAWLASMGVNTPIIQLLGRWSSAAIELYVQAAPLAVAPDVPLRILGDDVEIVSVRPAYGGAISEATAPPALGHQPPLALEDGEPAQEETPPHEDHSPTVAFEPGPVRPETVKQVAVAPPEHLIYNERQKRAHAPDPTEASSDRFLWKARGCSWPYGIRSFYRITELPAGAAKCLRCFPKAPSADGVGSPTEEAASPVASSSDSDGILLSCRSPPLTAPPFIPAGPLAMGPQLVADVLTDFDDLATSAGAGPDLVEYLKARSLNRTATLALVADEWSDVDARVFQPFRDGDEIAGKTYKAMPAEQPFSTPTPAPSTAAPPPATLPTMVGEKPPRTFPEWTDLVARYNAVQLGGEPRSFPAERLVGAEEVLAQDPLGAHQVQALHAARPRRDPGGPDLVLPRRRQSPRRRRRSTGGIKFVDGGLAVEENQPFVPRGIWAVVDGLDAI
ncbi:DNMT3A [Symbiodinium sp. CCMP2592]|nr:DNMT3A [Symbiodinium sp. CCMP2592]